MKPQIIKADIAGYMVKFPDEHDVFYVGESCPPIGNGFVYKDRRAFEDQIGICYTPERDFENLAETRDLECDSILQERLAEYLESHGMDDGYVALDVGYTWDDLRDCVYNWIGDQLNEVCEDDHYFELFVDYIQEKLFDLLDWQMPETLLSEWDVIEQWENAPQLSCEDPRLTDKQRKELGYE